ncbi:MAG: TIGR03936 family radical SAM-associated protein [Peptococcaceae bacterium]|nr:TIGR03936 family radical SAM-associated protein [Peptococcaceae bacterium]
MKVRMAYTKKEAARFIAHLDMTRLFQRAFRRAAVEIVYSEGFNPHPKISFGAPLPVGLVGEREYVDIEVMDLRFEHMREAFVRLSSQMPPGIEVLAWQILPERTPKLMALLDTAVYRVEVPIRNTKGQERGVEVRERLSVMNVQTVDHWLAQKGILWERKKEGKVVTLDIRPFIRSISLVGESPAADAEGSSEVELEIVTVLGNAGSVRPTEILGAFGRDEGVAFDLDRARVKRTGVYWMDVKGERRAPDEV